MNTVLIIPTGIGAAIGGHAGDANPVAKLLASVSDTLITHPNVVNASDINEITENTLYVDGYLLDRFLEGKTCLKRVNYNKILCVTNPPLKNEVVNSVSAARSTIGADIEIAVLETPLKMAGMIMSDGIATGTHKGIHQLINQVKNYKFDALAITTPIKVNKKTAINYLKNGGVNPWGRIEAIVSNIIAGYIGKPVAHSPVEEILLFKDIVDPRISAEMVSTSYLHCILKGLHKAPQPAESGLSINDIDFLITPVNCVGVPHYACMSKGIKIIAVKENTTCMGNVMPDEFIIAENYLEAAGIISAYKAGIMPSSVRRPLKPTNILNP